MKKFLILLAATALLVSCGSASKLTRGEVYAPLYNEAPVTLLVMPPINNTANVEAKDLLYTSISRPLVEAGYYVLPPILTMDILKAESAYDAELFFEAPVGQFGTVFGADAVIFSVIDKWAKQGVGISAKIRYVMRSTRTNEVLFDRSCDLFLDTSVSTSSKGLLGLVLDVALTAVNTALTDHIEAARKANNYIFSDIPFGKFSPLYQQDQDWKAEPANVKAVVKE
jgi:hypothetical protein